MAGSLLVFVVVVVLLSYNISSLGVSAEKQINGNEEEMLIPCTECEEQHCDFYDGKWVYDQYCSSGQFYEDSSDCPYKYMLGTFDCLKNGRPDRDYIKYRWQPIQCNLPRFDGKDFLSRLRGKSILFVGDSISLNQWQSLICMLHRSAPHANFALSNASLENNILSDMRSSTYDTNIMLHRNGYLIEFVNITGKQTYLKIDSISLLDQILWTGMDVIIFNSWHWWTHTGRNQNWRYIEYRNKKFKDMDRLRAFEIALNTWAHWVDMNIDPTRTRIFFQGVSPNHSNGSDWEQPKETCAKQREPVFGLRYQAGRHPAQLIVEKVISNMKFPVHLLNVTRLSELRKDAHPSFYANNTEGTSVNDCSHWCLPGVPDTWNELFYATLIQN